MQEFLIDEFYQRMRGVDLDVYGIVDTKNRIHTLGTDSKIIGRVFEILMQPVLEEIAAAHGLILETPQSQTDYPDFVMMTDKDSKEKIAIDIKTTYVKKPNSSIKFALGSYTSYLRTNKKNIQYVYTDYAKHYVIGVVYQRNAQAQESLVYDNAETGKIEIPYKNVRYFIQEKYKIAGENTGSGNTESIGSFRAGTIEELREGKGPFAELGKDIFELYWMYYPKYRNKEKAYTTLEEFRAWFLQQDPAPLLLHPYDCREVRRKLEQMK